MPAFNAGKYIREAISSVLAQTFVDFELLIINDGSTDDTCRVIDSFNDFRIKMVTQKNKGIAHALNKGLSIARAPYIARFDADDVCYPERLQVQYDFITRNPEYTIIGSSADYMDVKGAFLFTHKMAASSQEDIRKLNYRVCPFIHSTVFYKKEEVMKSGGYNPYAYTFEDHFLWMAMLKTAKAHNFQQALIRVRLNPESITIDERWRTREFMQIKYKALKTSHITAIEGDRLHQIGERQVHSNVKEASYYALCGKKFLVNNYRPASARIHVEKAIRIHPFRLENYLLYTASYLPEQMVRWLHKKRS